MPNAPSTGLHLRVPSTASNPFNAAPDFVGALLLTDERSDPYRGNHNSHWHDQASMRLQDGAKAVHFRLVFRLRLRPSSAAELSHLPRQWNFRVQIMPGWRSLELYREDLL